MNSVMNYSAFNLGRMTLSPERATTLPARCMQCSAPMEYPICCTSCGTLIPPPDGLDFFVMFNLPTRFDIDENELHRKYLALSRNIHPDVVDKSTDQNRRNSLQLSSMLNRAYETLRGAVSRAEYLLVLAGGPSPRDDRSVPGETLAKIMVLRENIEEAREAGDQAALQQIRREVADHGEATRAEIIRLARNLANDAERDTTMKALRRQLNAMQYWQNLGEQLPAAGPACGKGPHD